MTVLGADGGFLGRGRQGGKGDALSGHHGEVKRADSQSAAIWTKSVTHGTQEAEAT